MFADPNAYKPPHPPAMVVWFPSPGMETFNAVVTMVGRDAINVAVVPPESRALLVKEGVKYVNDPRVKTKGWDPEVGLWDYTLEHKQFVELLNAFMTPGDAK